MDIKTPLRDLGPAFRLKAKILSKIGLETIEDMLFNLPYRYDSNLLVSKIGVAQAGETVTVQGTVTKVTSTFTRGKLTIQRITVEDETGVIECVFFNQRFLLNAIHEGDFISVAGRVEQF